MDNWHYYILNYRNTPTIKKKIQNLKKKNIELYHWGKLVRILSFW